MPNPKVKIRTVLNDKEYTVASILLNENLPKNQLFIAISEYDEIIGCGILDRTKKTSMVKKVIIAHGFENLGYEALMWKFEP